MSVRFRAVDQKFFYTPGVGGGASTLSVGLRVKVDVSPTGGNRYVLLGDVGEGAWAVEVYGGYFYLSFWVGGVWTYAQVAVTAGQTYDLVMAQAPGAQTFYANGAAVYSASAAGSLGSFVLAFASGQGAEWSTETVAPDVTVDRPWVAASVPTAADVLALRDGLKTPADVFGASLLFWLTFDGTAGQVPQATDPGLTGQGGTATSVTVGGSPTYAAALVYVPPVYCTPCTTTDGKGLYLQFYRTSDDAPSSGGTLNTPVTVNTHPTVQLNGGAATAVSTPAPLLLSNYALYKLPWTLADTDVLTVTSSGGTWAQSQDGYAGALNAAAAPRRAILPAPAATATMKLGWNTPQGGLQGALTPLRSNWFDYAYPMSWESSGTYALDANGLYPTVLNGTLRYYAGGNPDSSSTARTGLPTPEGHYTFKWKNTTGVTFAVEEANGVGTFTQVGVDTTDPDGSHARVYSLAMPDTGRYDAQIWLRFTQAGGACDLSDVRVYPPGEPTDGSETYSVNLMRQLGPKPSCLRFMDALATNNSNVTAYGQPSSTTTYNITSVAPATNAYLTCQGPIRLTTDAPHGLVKGQWVTLGSSAQWDSLTWSTTDGGSNWALSGLPGIVDPIDATTFEMRVYYTATLTQSATFAPTYPTATMQVNGQITPADMVGLGARANCDVWVNAPHLMPAAEQRKFFDALFALLPAGMNLWVEYTNEHWNAYSAAFQQWFHFQGLAALAGTNGDVEYAALASACHDQADAAAAAAGKSSQLRRVMGSQWAGSGITQRVVDWCTANGKSFDAVGLAPYLDVGPSDSGSQAWWDAADHDLMFDAAELFLTRDYSHNNNTAVHKSIIAPIAGAVVVGYEGSLQKLRATYSTADQEDCYLLPYLPRARDVFDDWCSRHQSQGMAVMNLYELTQPCGGGGNSWGAYTSPTTVAGVGDGSDGLNDNVSTGFDEKRVVSVVGRAANLWMSASATATGFTLSGPSSGAAWRASGAFTVTPNGTTTGTFTPTPAAGVTFTPAALTWSGDATPRTFTVTAAPGSYSVNGTFSNGLTPPAPAAYRANSEGVFVHSVLVAPVYDLIDFE